MRLIWDSSDLDVSPDNEIKPKEKNRQIKKRGTKKGCFFKRFRNVMKINLPP